MSSRQQIDSVIDDDDEFCPLCIEEFDLSDKNFKPCPCGYQICQFCYNNIKTHSEEGRCPNCRRPYDDSTIEYKVPNADEFKADLALKHRKAAAAKKKETEKREIEASSRKNLAGVRVVQKNLVYVIGLNPTIRDENQLLQTLRGKDYFGQYGDIDKIVVSKAKPGGNPNQGIGVYVTFSRRADAATCIAAVDGSVNGDRVLRAQYGTTKYCSSFLRNEQCSNRNCTFLHETGEDSDSYSRQDLSSMNTLSSQRQANAPHPRTAQPISYPMRRQPSKDDSVSGRQSVPDGPALPSSASWANKDAAVGRTRRASLAGSQASQSPRPASATVAPSIEEPKLAEKPSPVSQEVQQMPMSGDRPPATQPETAFDRLLKAVTSSDFKFVFSVAELPSEEVKLIQNYPSFIDPYGGVKRRAMREKLEQERVKREQELLQTAAAEEDNREAGSLQLGGEPDEVNTSRSRQSRESHGAIQPPSQQGTADNSTVGSPVSAASHQFQGLNLTGRSLTPVQQQQLMLLKSASNQQAGLPDPLSSGSLEQATQARQGLLQNQMAQFNALQAQNRQSSRFPFTNEAGSKNMTNARVLNQMQPGTPNPLSAPSPQQALASGFYGSGVQGPPPGLKTAGTPPISGGGMFAQGHGFTSNANLGLGTNMGKQDATPELMRELLRGRGGTNVGGLQGQEAAKRESLFPFLQQHQTPPPLTPANGLLSSLYGSQIGTYPESGGPQKQKKKGKKHRHANTSSGGGGVVDLADPSILQARMHQAGVNATAGQALYGSQGQEIDEFPPLGVQSSERRPVDSFGFLKSSENSVRAGTPTLPPGLPLPHAHPTSALQERIGSSDPSSPAPMFPPGLGTDFPSHDTPNNDSVRSRPSTPGNEKDVPHRPGPVRNASEISFGSPVPRSASKARSDGKGNQLAAAKDVQSKSRQPLEQSVTAASDSSPIKLDASLVSQSQEALSATTEPLSAAVFGPATSSASAVGSRPNTPLTSASRISDSSTQRQPRVLRVVDTPKTETPPPLPSAPSVTSLVGTNKSRSRRQSLSSNSRPDTPAELGSEADLYPSASVSRANSPPASSRIGSAPVRSVTKSQAKKERRQKAKEADAKKVETASVTEEAVQAPIIGRKRKTKKAPTSTVEPAAAPAGGAPEATSPAEGDKTSPLNKQPKPDSNEPKAKDKPIEDVKPISVKKEPATEHKAVEEWHSHNTVGQLIKDAEATGHSIKGLFMERTKSLPELLARLHKAGQIDLNKSSLFSPANLAPRTDMKCTPADYDKLNRPIKLTEEHRRALLRGEFVRIGSELKFRHLITPRGCVIPCLTSEEENRYIELEKKGCDVGDPLLDDSDPTNTSGGLEALFATPEKFNIRWVDDVSDTQFPNAALAMAELSMRPVPPNALTAMDADSTRTHDWAVASTAELVNSTPAAVQSFAAATAKHMLGGSGPPRNNPDLDDVAAMTDEELKMFANKSQRDLETTRKELDGLEKKFAGLLRRNKKLAQQALTLVSDE